MPEFFAQPDDLGELHASQLHSSLGESVGAQAGEAFMGGTRTLYRLGQYAHAAGNPVVGENLSMADVQNADDLKAQIPDVSADDAKARLKQEGLDGLVTMPNQPSIKKPVLDLMVQHGHEKRDYDAAVSRGPQGFFPGALGLVTSLGAGIIDPVNLAAFSIPVVGEARFGMMMAGAGESLMGRAAVRAGVGAGQGAVGATALLPGEWWLHTRDGQDFTMADALHSVVMGAGMGAGMHAGIGAFRDIRARSAGNPLEHSPEAHLHDALRSDPYATAEPLARDSSIGETAPGIGAGENNAPAGLPEALPSNHPARILADLPPRAQEDVVRSAIADIVQDRPVRAGQMLVEAAKEDPRIAETLDAWHGSPHDFEAFSSERIGTGEGAATYGHGLYFAENADVARSYARKLSSPTGGAGGMNSAGIRLADFKPPNVYRVRIAADKEKFLDWDKPLSEQPQVLEKLKDIPQEEWDKINAHLKGWGLKQVDPARLTGEELHDLLGGASKREASRLLHDAGIPGIKYLDEGSRKFTVHTTYKSEPYSEPVKFPTKAAAEGWAAEQRAKGFGADVVQDGTRNFVVFNDKDVAITHKNGVAVAKADRPAARADLRAKSGPQSLLQFIAARGGIDPKDPLAADLLQSFGGKNPTIAGHGKLIREGGKSLDALREGAVEAGYLHDAADEHGGVTESTIQHLLDGVDQEARGSKQYPAGEAPAKSRAQVADDAARSHDERMKFIKDRDQAFETALDDREIGDRRAEVKVRARTLMDKDDALDPDAAIGRAFDEMGMGRATDATPQRADWKKLGDVREAYDDPRAIEESNEAARTPEPASIEPEKAPTAAEAAAKDAEQLLNDMKSSLTEEEWQSLQDSLDKVAKDKGEREEIVRDGAACLAAAAA